MKEIKNWFRKQSKQSKIILLITFILHLGVAIYQTPSYLLQQYGLSVFLGRLSGQLSATMISLLLISAVIAFILYLIFRGVAEECKKYLDYFAPVFLIISIILLYFGNFYKPF